MPMYGANVAVFKDDLVLLTRREDFEVWCLPGGHKEPDETFAQCAIREVYEETGFEIVLTRMVGTYSRLNWSSGFYHVELYAAQTIGGEALPQAGEVLELRYFPVSDLPDALLVGQHHRIMDAAKGLTGVVKTELIEWPLPGKNRTDLYRMKEESALSPSAFYLQHFPPLRPDQIRVELAGSV